MGHVLVTRSLFTTVTQVIHVTHVTHAPFANNYCEGRMDYINHEGIVLDAERSSNLKKIHLNLTIAHNCAMRNTESFVLEQKLAQFS